MLNVLINVKEDICYPLDFFLLTLFCQKNKNKNFLEKYVCVQKIIILIYCKSYIFNLHILNCNLFIIVIQILNTGY